MLRLNVSQAEVIALVPKVASVLKKATKKGGARNVFLSAYQVLQELDPKIRDGLLNKFGQGGDGSGNVPAATKVVMKALLKVPDIEIMYMYSNHATFWVLNGNVVPAVKKRRNKFGIGVLEDVTPAGDEYFAIYRLPTGSTRSRRCKLPFGTAAASVKARSRRQTP